jgi:secreted Zn-dependent insulinase-like peptidase
MDFFDDLRTKQQLGYVAKGLSGLIADIEKPFSIYTFIVQSNHKESEELKVRIEKYVNRQKR